MTSQVSHKISTSLQKSILGIKKSDSESVASNGPLRLFDDIGNDITPLPMIIVDKRLQNIDKENTIDPSVLQSASLQHHGTAFSRSILSISNPFLESASDTSEDHGSKVKEAPFKDKLELMSKEIPSAYELKKHVDLLITEDETFWLFDQQPSMMIIDSEYSGYQTRRNSAYRALCSTRAGNDRYVNRGMNTFNRPTIVKLLQTDEIKYADKGVTATVCDMWDTIRQKDEEEHQAEVLKQEAIQLERLIQSGRKPQTSETSKKVDVSSIPSAISRLLMDSIAPLQLATLNKDMYLPTEKTQPVGTITASTDEFVSFNVQDSGVGSSDRPKSGLEIVPRIAVYHGNIENPVILQLLNSMERALNLNTFHEKLVIYRSTTLSKLIVPTLLDRSDTELSSQFITGHAKTGATNLTEENTIHTNFGGTNQRAHSPSIREVTGIAIDKRHHSSAPNSTLGGPANSIASAGSGGDKVQSLAENPVKVDNPVYSGLLDLGLLWKFTCYATKGRNISDMAFNVRNKDILAVGYGDFAYDNQRSGLVCCWSLKNIGYPERMYLTTSGVSAVAWSARNDNLLAVGMFSGVIQIFDVRKKENIPIIDTTHVSGRHYGPIRRLQWVIREAGRSIGDSESLISLSMDGRVSEWFVLKGFDCAGECDFNGDLMVLKRPSTHTTVQKSKLKKKPEALIARHAVGTAMSFNPTESNNYLVGTENGQIHRCSCSYTEQYLSSYLAHTASVYSIQWSKYITEVFLSCSADWTIKLWHADRPQPYLNIATHSSSINDIAWSPRHACIFACCNESYLEIWNLEVSTLDPIHIETVCVDSSISVVRFTDDSETLMVGDSLGIVYVYAMKNFPMSPSPSVQALQLNAVLDSCLSLQV